MICPSPAPRIACLYASCSVTSSRSRSSVLLPPRSLVTGGTGSLAGLGRFSGCGRRRCVVAVGKKARWQMAAQAGSVTKAAALLSKLPPKEKGGGVGVGGVGRLKRKGGGRGQKESKEDREGQPTPAFQPASPARGERPAHSRSLTFPRSFKTPTTSNPAT